MKRIKNKFEDVMSKRTDEQLQEVIGSPAGYYEPEAIEAAKREIDNRNLNKSETEPETNLEWRCSNCGVLNNASAKFCPQCGLEKVIDNSEWECSGCGIFNDASANFCPKCGEAKKRNSVESNNRPEATTLKIVGTIVLVIGIISSIILFVFQEDLLIIILVLIVAIVIWALLRAFSSTSTDIKEIRKKLNDK